MSFDEMMNSHKNPPQNNPQNGQLHHSISSQQMNRGNLVVPPLMNTHSHPHHNMVFNQQYQYGHGHHYAQSPQPQMHQMQNNQYNQYPQNHYQNNLQAPQNMGPPRWS